MPKGPEDELLQWVLDVAGKTGWFVLHIRPAQTDKGWRTPIQGDGKGYVDLTLFREKIIFAELKGHRYRKLNPEQVEWRDAIVSAGGEYHLWRPEDKDLIIDTLGKGRIKDETSR